MCILPIYLTVISLDIGLTMQQVGILLGFGPLCGIISTPALNYLVKSWGSEICVLLASLGFVIGFGALGFITRIEPGQTQLYFLLTMLCQVVLGVCGGMLCIGE